MVSFQIVFFTGVNCTKEDLEALTNTNNDVELLEFDENELWFEKSYKYVALNRSFQIPFQCHFYVQLQVQYLWQEFQEYHHLL